jgi:hypothetical protein
MHLCCSILPINALYYVVCGITGEGEEGETTNTTTE